MSPLAVAQAEFWFGGPYLLALAAAGLILFVALGALSHAHERPFSAALIYLVIGLVVDAIVRGTDLSKGLDPIGNHVFLERASTLAMIVALFTTGMRIRRPPRHPGWLAPLRLLGIAMPVTIVAVAAWAWGVMGLGLGAAIVLGAALAPTDPVLAGALGVRPPDEKVDEADHEREFAISVEAGGNDGLALPFLALGLLVAEGRIPESLGAWVGINLVYASVLPIVAGYLAGRALGSAVRWLREREFMLADLDPWVGVAAAPLVYGCAELLSLYGFLAVFAAGYGYRRRDAEPEARRRVHAGVNSAQLFLEISVILVIGLLVTFDGLSEPGVAGWLLVPVLFLVIRPAAALVSLIGSSLGRGDRAFLAWFGVKGVASVNYLAIAVGAGALAGDELTTVVWTILVVVCASIVVHGVSATPALDRLQRGERG
jgi:NhaP-type Na+/H+ or K+/H+ antiporter